MSVAGVAVLQALLPRLDSVSLCAPWREGSTARPASYILHGHCLPGHEEGRCVRARRAVPLRSQRLRVLAAPNQVRCKQQDTVTRCLTLRALRAFMQGPRPGSGVLSFGAVKQLAIQPQSPSK